MPASVTVDFPIEIGDCRPREMGALSTFSAFRGDMAATAPRGTYFATRHHEAFRIERRANHSTHGSTCAYHTTTVASFFPPPLLHIAHDAVLYIFLCCIKCLSPRYYSRDALLQYMRAVRYVFITYSPVSFHLYDGPLMFNLLRVLAILFMRGESHLFAGVQHQKKWQREKGRTSSRIIKFLDWTALGKYSVARLHSPCPFIKIQILYYHPLSRAACVKNRLFRPSPSIRFTLSSPYIFQ